MCFWSSRKAVKEETSHAPPPAQPVPSVEKKQETIAQPSSKRLERRKAFGPDAYEMVGDYIDDGRGQLKVMRNIKANNEEVLVKFVGTNPKEGIPKGLEREIINHRRLLHPNIVQFYEVFSLEDSVAIVSEMPSGGILSHRIHDNGPVTEAQAKSLFLNLLAGMSFCHDTKIYHRDLRPENMFLDERDGVLVLKISGFGYSKSAVYDSAPRTRGFQAPLNIPPELLKGGAQQAAYDGSKVDIWGAATVLYFMLTGQHAFEDLSSPGELNRVVMNRIVNCEYSYPPGINLSPECQNFISNLFVPRPEERMSVGDMHRSPWLTGAKLPRTASEPAESKQTTGEIEDVVARARARRAARQQEQRAGQFPVAPSVNRGLPGGQVNVEYGIAEVR